MMDNSAKNPSFEMTNIEAIGIGLASPKKILEWSRGEVKKPETIKLPHLKTRTGRIVLREDFSVPRRTGNAIAANTRKSVTRELCATAAGSKSPRPRCAANVWVISNSQHLCLISGISGVFRAVWA
jgi:hypothetical protein